MAEEYEDLNIYYDGNNVPISSDSSSDNSSDNSDTSDYVTADVVQGMIKTALSQLTVPLSSGAGSNAFNVTNQGLYLGSGTFATAPFSVTMAGVLRATGAIISGSITATSGTIGGFSIGSTTISSTGLTLTSGASASLAFGTVPPTSPSSGTGIYIDKTGLFGLSANTQNFIISAANGSITAISGTIAGATFTSSAISSSNYASGSIGWTISNSGNAEFNNILVRGEFHSSVLSYASVQVTAGSTLLALSGGSLRADVTTATSPTTFNVDINDPPSGHIQVFAANDILRIKDGSGNDNWMTVSSVSDQTTFFRYVCTKNNGTNATFRAGAAVADYGQSGQGLIFNTVDQTNAPYMSIQTHTGSPWSSVTEQVRIGQLNGINGFVSSTYGISIGQITTGNYLTYDTASGKLVVNGSPITNEDIFGDGSDGTLAGGGGTKTLTRDTFYSNATLNSGDVIVTNGFRLFVSGTLTINSGAFIRWNGNNGNTGGNASGITGGSAGSSPGPLASGSVNGTVDGGAGTAGATGVSVNNGAGQNSSASSTGTSVTKAITGNPGVKAGQGASGGTATGGSTSPNGTGGSVGTAGTVSGTIFNTLHTGAACYLLQDLFPSLTPLTVAAGSTGGTGGGDGAASFANGNSASSGGGGGGGSAGTPGGIVPIFARIIVNAGTIQALGGNGGNGGNGTVGTVSQAGAGGGGGGGGGAPGPGGVIIMVFSAITDTGTESVAAGSVGSGGTGGTGAHFSTGTANNGATGSNGATAASGTIIKLQV